MPLTAPAAVVGAGGFIGSHLVAALRDAGVHTAALTRSDPPTAALGRVATIFYLATSVRPATADAELADRDHEAFARLLDAVASAGRRPTLVLASSGGGGTIYDPASPPPYREDSPVGPASAYGRAKLRLERELLSRADVVRPLVLRLANTYGPGQRPRGGLGVVAHWLRAAATGEPLVVFGDPGMSRDYVYVGDVVEAMLRVHGRDALPAVLNIGSGRAVTLERLLATVTGVVDGPLTVRYEPTRSSDLPASWLDVRAAARHLRWRARTDLADGIRRSWAHWVGARDRSTHTGCGVSFGHECADRTG